MSNITFRVGLGRPLTHEELDNNFRYLHDWQSNTPYFEGQYVYYEIGSEGNIWIARYDIPAVPFFNPQDWKKLGESSGGLSGTVIDDKFTFATGVQESPFTLSQNLSQLIAVEVNGDDRVDTDDFYYDNVNNQIFFVSTLYNLQDGDVIVVKYTTSDILSGGGGATNENLKNVRTIAPVNGSTENVLATDEYLAIQSDNLTTGFTLQLPSSPEIGHEIKFIDVSGNVGTIGLNYIIAADPADNIEGNSSVIIPAADYATFTIVYLGSNLWKIL